MISVWRAHVTPAQAQLPYNDHPQQGEEGATKQKVKKQNHFNLNVHLKVSWDFNCLIIYMHTKVVHTCRYIKYLVHLAELIYPLFLYFKNSCTFI